MMNTYTRGQLVRLTLTATDGSAPVSPASVVCRVRDPAGVETQPTVVVDAAGAYHADIAVLATGFWQYRWSGAAPAQGAAEGLFHVRESEFV